MLPRVSFIIPVYNSEKTLRRCLGAALNQSYPHFELIVVNNASTDQSKEIILEFAQNDQRIHYVEEPCKSRGAARNRGIKVSLGSIIVMTDADCIVPYYWIEKIISPIIHNFEQVVVGNEEDLVCNYWTKLQQEANQVFLNRHLKNLYIDHLDTKNFAIQRKCIENAGLFNSKIENLEDFELKIRLKKLGYKILFLKNLCVKHNHSNNLKQLFLKRIDQGFWAKEIYFLHKEYFQKHPEEIIKSIQIRHFMLFFPWIISFSFKNNVNRSFYELITGVAWRLGILGIRIA